MKFIRQDEINDVYQCVKCENYKSVPRECETPYCFNCNPKTQGVQFIIKGRRWFDRVNGNTYHSVTITKTSTNELIYSSGMCYGYGDSYEHTAKQWLLKKGYIKELYDHDLNRQILNISVSDGLKRELDKEVFEEVAL